MIGDTYYMRLDKIKGNDIDCKLCGGCHDGNDNPYHIGYKIGCNGFYVNCKSQKG